MSAWKYRVCRVCGVPNTLAMFKPGKNLCKGCRSEESRAYYEANKEYRLEYRRAYYEANRESSLEYRRAYYEANKESSLEYQRAYYEANKESSLEYQRAYYEDNKESIKEYSRAYKWRRRRSDPLYALKERLRRSTGRALKPYGKDTATATLLGMGFEDFYARWEKLCRDAGLAIGEAVIDHCVPLAAATTKTEAELMSHWSNLQPLTAEENLKKGDRVLPEFEQRLSELRAVAWLIDALLPSQD